MRFNERELAYYASLKSDREGRLNYRSPNAFREGYKERWFKLKGNLLFYFRLNAFGGVFEREPIGVFVIENCNVLLEESSQLSFAFSIVFHDDEEKKHMFSCTTLQQSEFWVKSLRESSYEHWRSKLHSLRLKIQQKQSLQQEPKQLFHPVSSDAKVNISNLKLWH